MKIELLIATLMVCVLTLAGLWFITGYCTDFIYSGSTINSLFWPWQCIIWAAKWFNTNPDFWGRVWIYIISVILSNLFILNLYSFVRRRQKRKSSTYGTAEWAKEKDLAQAGLLNNEGVVFGQTADAVLKSNFKKSSFAAFFNTPARNNSSALAQLKMGRHLLTHNGAEHVFCFAPTGSFKTVSAVIPTLLNWPHSAVIYDIKKELWRITAGWRASFSFCFYFDPTSVDSIRINPLAEIRKGAYEVKDTQLIAEAIVSAYSTKENRDHWRISSCNLIVGVILHLLYDKNENDKTLAAIPKFLSNPHRSLQDTLEHMLNYPHLGEEAHPVVTSCAKEMLNKAPAELSGIVSTAMSFFGLYQDSIIARNTSVSDITIDSLVYGKSPLSLYLVVPPSDIERTKPVIRLLLDLIGKRLTEKMDVDNRHRLLMMLDEFPTLGHLDFFETQLAYLRSYHIKCFLIAQSLNQIEKVYGAHNAILDNSHIRVTYGALDEKTAKRISDLLGQSTVLQQQFNLSGERFSPLLGNVSQQHQEAARPLLTAGEILQLPAEDALVMVGNTKPYKAKKILYYQDMRFKNRAGLPTPQQDAELRGFIKNVA